LFTAVLKNCINQPNGHKLLEIFDDLSLFRKSWIILIVKIIFTLLFIFSLISAALAGVRIEAHDDHTHEEISVIEHSHHSHEHSSENDEKDSDSTGDCPHFHIHCTSLCLGVLLTHNFGPNPLSYDSKVTSFSIHKLSPQDFVNSLYRPPIA